MASGGGTSGKWEVAPRAEAPSRRAVAVLHEAHSFLVTLDYA